MNCLLLTTRTILKSNSSGYQDKFRLVIFWIWRRSGENGWCFCCTSFLVSFIWQKFHCLYYLDNIYPTFKITVLVIQNTYLHLDEDWSYASFCSIINRLELLTMVINFERKSLCFRCSWEHVRKQM